MENRAEVAAAISRAQLRVLDLLFVDPIAFREIEVPQDEPAARVTLPRHSSDSTTSGASGGGAARASAASGASRRSSSQTAARVIIRTGR